MKIAREAISTQKHFTSENGTVCSLFISLLNSLHLLSAGQNIVLGAKGILVRK